jgi:hypothetical protein
MPTLWQSVPEELLEELELDELDDELLDELLQGQVPKRSGSQALSSAKRFTTAHMPAGM